MKEQVNKILEDIQEATIEGNGAFIRQDQLRNMKVGDLIEMLLPNGVEFVVKHVGKETDNTSTKVYYCPDCNEILQLPEQGTYFESYPPKQHAVCGKCGFNDLITVNK